MLETIAREGNTTFVDQLADDDLPGAPGNPDHSYLGLMRQNMRIMIPALGGNAAAFDDVDVSPVFEGRKRGGLSAVDSPLPSPSRGKVRMGVSRTAHPITKEM